jgi:hypothetical protein
MQLIQLGCYRGPNATQRFIQGDSLPQTLPNSRYAILGVMGTNLENIHLKNVFLKIAAGNLPSAQTSGYDVISAAIRGYLQHWRGGKAISVRPKTPSKTKPFAETLQLRVSRAAVGFNSQIPRLTHGDGNVVYNNVRI